MQLHHTSPVRRRDEAGASTAEHAAVTCGGVGFAAILCAVMLTDRRVDTLVGWIDRAISWLPW